MLRSSASRKLGSTDAHALAGNLDVSRMLGAIASQHDRQAGHAFAADDADLDAGLASCRWRPRRQSPIQ